MAEMAKICPYDQEYLSLLARRGQLEAKKISQKWFTTVEAVNRYLEEKKPGEKVQNQKTGIIMPKRIKLHLAWMALGVSFLILTLSFFIYQHVENKLSELETKTSQMERTKKNMEYPMNLPGYADFFAPGKLEF